jgi:hypothetical protein
MDIMDKDESSVLYGSTKQDETPVLDNSDTILKKDVIKIIAELGDDGT